MKPCLAHALPTQRWGAIVMAVTVASVSVADERIDFFERNIRPALIEHCYECHSRARGKSEGGLLLDSRPAMQRGGESGHVLVAGQPNESLLIEAIRYESLEMPPGKQLDAATIRLFEEWIQRGAADPREQETVEEEASHNYLEAARRFWAFQPREHVKVPQLPESWGAHPIDSFVWQKLLEQQLHPAAEADRATWLRRVTFDLLGLPPTVAQLDAFLEDPRADAYERVVDALLASPRYGERWGRYWLDLARYADSNGADENHSYPVAWRYRDYVVASYNADKSYDRMIHEQLAGDLMPARDEAERRDHLTATGFLILGPKMLAEQDKEKMVADIVDEQLDTVGKVFLGLTLGCARCHDHKFDPVTAEDYYALAGIFHSTKTMEHLNFVSRWNEQELPDTVRQREIHKHQRLLAQAETAVQELEDVAFAQQLTVLRDLMLAKLEGANGSEPAANAGSAETAQQPLRDFLANGAGIFRVWNQLSKLPPETFAEQAQRRWQTLKVGKTEPAKSAADRFERRLVAQPAPTSPAELVASYLAAFRQCRADVRDDADDRGLKRALFTGDKAAFAGDLTAYLPAEKVGQLSTARERMDALRKSMPTLDTVMAAKDDQVKLVALHVRGNHLQMDGDPLPRRVPQVLESPGPSATFPADASGRRELADWLTRADHPLTARVMVNRVWQGHFGHGLVRSPSNFGLRGEQPTHPALLDWLASDFVRGGWSLKRLHRQIVLSATYRMRSLPSPRSRRVDPDNRLLSHFPRRRLELEPIRDSLLAIAGALDSQIGGEVTATKGSTYADSAVVKEELDVPRRTIYLPVNRAALHPVFSTFDYVDPAVSLEQRPTTTVPHQTLFLMNHPLVMESGKQLAHRVLDVASTTEARVALIYKSTFARLPTPAEQRLAKRFLYRQHGSPRPTPAQEHAAWTSYCRSLLLTSEFLYVE